MPAEQFDRGITQIHGQIAFRSKEMKLKRRFPFLLWIMLVLVVLDLIAGILHAATRAFDKINKNDKFYDLSLLTLLGVWAITLVVNIIQQTYLVCVTKNLHWLMYKENLAANIGQIFIRLMTLGGLVGTYYLWRVFPDQEKNEHDLVWHYFFAFTPIFVLWETISNLWMRNNRDVI